MDDITGIEIDYLEKRKTSSQCIELLDCKLYSWRNHINNHVKPQVAIQLADRSEITDHIVDKVGEVIGGLDDLKEVMKILKQQILANPDPIMLKTYLSALAELRHYTETLQKLQNEFKDNGNINVQNMHVEYNQLVGTIMQDSCPLCKSKFAVSLKDVIRKIDNNPS